MNYKLVIIYSRFNASITNLLLEGALDQCNMLGIEREHISIIDVPGAVEIPLTAKVVAEKGGIDAIITLGCVIRGETTHYDYVCEQVSQGTQAISLEYTIPVIFGVLTTETQGQALARVGGAHGHKGRDAVDAAVEMIDKLKAI